MVTLLGTSMGLGDGSDQKGFNTYLKILLLTMAILFECWPLVALNRPYIIVFPPLLVAGRSVQLEEKGSSWDALHFLGAILIHYSQRLRQSQIYPSMETQPHICNNHISSLHTSSGSDLLSCSFTSFSSIQTLICEAPELCFVSPGEL